MYVEDYISHHVHKLPFCSLRLLLPIQLEKARLTFFLTRARRNFQITRRGRTAFEAESLHPLGHDDLQYLGATVGEKVVLTYQGRRETLFVSKMTSRGLLLSYPDDRDFAVNNNGTIGPNENSFLHAPQDLVCFARFHLAPFTYKVMETAVIDGLTAFGPTWFGDRPVRMTGLPLVCIFIFMFSECSFWSELMSFYTEAIVIDLCRFRWNVWRRLKCERA